MKIQNLIDASRVYLNLEVADVEGAMKEIGVRLAPATNIGAAVISQALLEREGLGSTSVGNGFAIPHCKIEGLSSIQVALGRFAAPVSFDDKNTSGVRFVFVVLSPPDQPALHLQVLSQIARTLKNEEVRTGLLEAPDEDAAVERVREMANREGL